MVEKKMAADVLPIILSTLKPVCLVLLEIRNMELSNMVVFFLLYFQIVGSVH